MIKKVLWLAVTLFTLIWVSFWFSWTNIYVWDTETTYLNYTQTPTSSANFWFSWDNVQRNIFFMKNWEWMNWRNTKIAFYYWTDLWLAFYSNDYSQQYWGIISWYYISTYWGYINFTRELNKNSSTRQMNSTWSDVLDLWLGQGDIDVIRYATTEWSANFWNYGILAICFASLSKDIEVCTLATRDTGANWFTQIEWTTIPVTYADETLFYPSQIPVDYLKNSPWTSWSSGGGWSDYTWSGAGWSSITVESDVWKSIKYFEDMYNWDQGMCYVWTNNLTAPYWTSWISFDFWTGDTIFSLFYSLYSWFGDNRIQNVWRFINTWLINYKQWFEKPNWNIQFLASYAWPWNNVEYIYTWFTFPFKNQPVAIYFMASLLNDQYSRYLTQWEEMAYYCYMKLNQTSIENNDISFQDVQNLVNPAINNNINTYINEVIWKWKVGFQVPNMSWSIWGDVVSWNNYQWTLDPSTIFDQLYDNVFSLVWNWSSRTWILPDWIVFPLLFLILFRIMKH